jgi:hypothetical protein
MYSDWQVNNAIVTSSSHITSHPSLPLPYVSISIYTQGGNPSYGFNDYHGGYADGTYGEAGAYGESGDYNGDPDDHYAPTPQYAPPQTGYSPAKVEANYAPAAAADLTADYSTSTSETHTQTEYPGGANAKVAAYAADGTLTGGPGPSKKNMNTAAAIQDEVSHHTAGLVASVGMIVAGLAMLVGSLSMVAYKRYKRMGEHQQHQRKIEDVNLVAAL